MPSPLDRERAGARFPVEPLTTILYGGAKALLHRRKLLSLVENEPIFRRDDRAFLSRSQAYERSLQKCHKLVELTKGWTDDQDLFVVRNALDEDIPFGLHYVMFIPTLRAQADEEQKKRWLVPALEHRILGTYAQTELGHGSFVGGLETTAVYDPVKQEFELHSPTLTSTKWWPGALGRTCTHAVVMARLQTLGVDYGPHPFVVQLRSLVDHMPLPGIELGDIGPKAGYETIDNGFLRMNRVRVARDCMLMGLAKVLPDGTYVRPANQKLSYGTMVYVRSGIVSLSGAILARATTIAVRYSCVRSQFPAPQGRDKRDDAARPVADPAPRETIVMDYVTQQAKLLPLVATSYAFHFLGAFMRELYKVSTEKLNRADLSQLMELHSTSAGLKAYTTAVAVEGIETCRRACGGHGYSKASGLVELYESFLPSCTYEGENTVMALTSGRYLVRSLQLDDPAEAPHTLGYLFAPAEGPAQPMPSALEALPGYLAAAFALRARHAVRGAASQGATDEDLCAASLAHSENTVLSVFTRSIEVIAGRGAPREIVAVLTDLALLFGLWRASTSLGGFLVSAAIDPADEPLLRRHITALFARLRPDAVALVDAWDIPDFLLNSALGRRDGNVYEALFAWAQNDPLNKCPVPPGYDKYIKPLVQSTRARM